MKEVKGMINLVVAVAVQILLAIYFAGGLRIVFVATTILTLLALVGMLLEDKLMVMSEEDGED